jgi:DNA repair protein RadA/Sms
MPTNAKTMFVCNNCGEEFSKWQGRCFNCGQWETIVEFRVPKHSKRTERHAQAKGAGGGASIPLSQCRPENVMRLATGYAEVDRVLGGGLVPGGVALVAGDPGIGKSTLLLQLCAHLSRANQSVLYISGEESAEQISLRAQRLGVGESGMHILTETALETALDAIAKLSPQVVVIDSIQTIFTEELESAPGSVSQVRECGAMLLRHAKQHRCAMFFVGHVTKEGAIAGPRVLEHIVDTVLYLEGERFHSYRLLRGVKNRFGSTNEIGLFEMTEEGMVEVDNPSQAFLAERAEDTSGSSVAVTLEGTRPILVEVQALTSTTSFGLPRRTANGIEYNRLLMLVAVLTKRVGLALANQDIYVNVVGGLKVSEPAIDLSVATAIASSFKAQQVDPEVALIGEIGLSGELRSVGQLERRLGEAAKLGFRRAIYPRTTRKPRVPPGLEALGVATAEEALAVALSGRES